ncbi:MAG: hypothetical protein KC646_13480 [Candidatus Cloacimonetes bacterium]|nr:hypothetical protein [Candidatus Cloacimonadota bacterium]
MFICVLDGQGRLVYCNKLAQNIMQAIGSSTDKINFFDLEWAQDNLEFATQESLSQFLQSFVDNTIIHCVIEVKTKQDEVKTCDWYNTKLLDDHSNIIGYTSMVLDSTSDLKMLQQAQQTEKMLALNSVVGGVVHDFNNILMVVLGYADLINTLSTKATISKYSKGIYKATEKGMRLAKKLNSFLKRQSDHPEDLVLSKVLDQTSDILKREEDLMDKYNYPDKDSHKSAHDVFSKSIEQYCLSIKKEPKNYKMLSKYLLSWFTKHIVTIDKELAEYINFQGN